MVPQYCNAFVNFMFRPARATIPIEPAAGTRLPEVRSDCPGLRGGIYPWQPKTASMLLPVPSFIFLKKEEFLWFKGHSFAWFFKYANTDITSKCLFVYGCVF